VLHSLAAPAPFLAFPFRCPAGFLCPAFATNSCSFHSSRPSFACVFRQSRLACSSLLVNAFKYVRGDGADNPLAIFFQLSLLFPGVVFLLFPTFLFPGACPQLRSTIVFLSFFVSWRRRRRLDALSIILELAFRRRPPTFSTGLPRQLPASPQSPSNRNVRVRFFPFACSGLR